MMPSLRDEEQRLVATATAFANDRVRPNATQWEHAKRIPLDVYKEASSLGLTKIQVPASRGGFEYSYQCKMRITEELAKASMAFSFSLINMQNIAAKLGREASAEVADEFVDDLVACRRFGATALTEPHAGSDFSSISTSAVEVDEGWRIDGEKAWITNAAFADVFVTYVQTDASKGWRGVACFLVDAKRPGFERVPQFPLFGGNAIATGGYKLDGYIAPREHLLHPPGEAFKVALTSINGARTYVAAMCCGMVDDALACATNYAHERSAFGQPVIANQGVRWRLADIATDLEAARLLTYKAASLIDEGSSGAILAASHAKKFAARMAETRLPECIQTMGANGLLEEHRLGQQLACAKIAHYVDGSTEIQNERIASLLFDRE